MGWAKDEEWDAGHRGKGMKLLDVAAGVQWVVECISHRGVLSPYRGIRIREASLRRPRLAGRWGRGRCGGQRCAGAMATTPRWPPPSGPRERSWAAGCGRQNPAGRSAAREPSALAAGRLNLDPEGRDPAKSWGCERMPPARRGAADLIVGLRSRGADPTSQRPEDYPSVPTGSDGPLPPSIRGCPGAGGSGQHGG